MNLHRLLLAAAALTTAASAQAIATSPRGFDAIDGNTAFLHFTPVGSTVGRRFQQIDNTQGNTAFPIRSLGWRRDGGTTGGGTTVPPRTLDLEITMGSANMGMLTRVFDQNYASGTRQVVFTKKSVNMPDWSGNAGTPAPFDFTVMLDTPFVYVPIGALVIDFTHENLVYVPSGPAGGCSVDRAYFAAMTTNATRLGSGCVASTSTGVLSTFDQLMRLENNGPSMPDYGMRMRISATNAPFSTPVALNIDLSDQNLTIPGLCTTLRAGPVASLMLGVADGAGVVPETSISFRHFPQFIGAQLVTQLAALDAPQPGIPAVLSNGSLATFPNDPASTSLDCVYAWASLPNPSGTLFFGGGLVLQLL
jgi:hypothetical protein